MPKSVKKTNAVLKAAAKPRKPAAKKADLLQMETPVKADGLQMDPRTKADVLQMEASKSISHEQVAQLAHRFWNERGRAHGHDAEDWFRAEKQLRGKASEELLRGRAS